MKYLLTNQETERLNFRKLEISDFNTWMTLFKDYTTRENLGMSEFKTAEECCEKWFEWTFNRYDNNLGGQNILILKDTDEIVGQCGLLVREIDNEFEIEIAYSILPMHRMKGYAIESAKKCKDFAFHNDFHSRLVSIITPHNLQSINVASKNGLILDREIIFNGKKMELFQINKTDWKNSNLI